MVPKLLLHAVKCACSFVDEETKAQRTRPRGTLWGGDGRTEPFIQQMHLEHSLCTSDTLAMCRAPVGPGVWVVEAIALSWVCVCGGGDTWLCQSVLEASQVGWEGGRQEKEAGPGCGFPGCSTWGRGQPLVQAFCLFVSLKSAMK